MFTGKELDEDTQLYYFGARYYDPRTSVWQSPDPILADYLQGVGNQGVFNPANLALYGYSYQRPVVLNDPSGKLPDANRFTNIQRISAGAPIDYVQYPRTRGQANPLNTNYAYQNANALDGLSGFYKNRSRYIYTTSRGPIDLRHYFAFAADAVEGGGRQEGTPGIFVEQMQGLGILYGGSSWNYEDLMSNEMGADLGQLIVDRQVSSPQELENVIVEHLTSLGG